MSSGLESRSSQVSPMLFTGIDALDRMLGGIPNGSVIVLHGRPGSGFDIFAQQILFTQANSNGAKALYFTVEHPIEDITSEMISRNWDIDKLTEKNKWEFFDAYTIRSNIRKGVAGPKVLLDSLKEYSKKMNQEVWSVLDTFSYYILNYESKEIMEVVDDIIANARENGGLHFLLIVEGMLDTQTITNISHLTDGLFKFNLDESQSDPLGVIRIDKLRKVDYVTRMIPYKITADGLSIETSVRMG